MLTNKKLVLCIVMNVLFAFALSVLLYLVYPQFIYELDSVSNLWGRYSIRTYRKDSGSAYFEVLMGHRRLYSYSAKQRFFVEELGMDITGDGVPNLVIRQWLGSVHGDSKYLVLEVDDSVVNEIGTIDGLLDVKFQDLNNDGIFEITGKDKAYIYFDGDSFTSSPLPLVILSYNKSLAKFVPDKKLMLKSPFPQDQLDILSLKYKENPRWSKEFRPPSELFVTMLELIYSGNKKQAWELFNASWPNVSNVLKEQYKEALEKNLRKSPFYPAIANWNKLLFIQNVSHHA
jgi:hypothetical protein